MKEGTEQPDPVVADDPRVAALFDAVIEVVSEVISDLHPAKAALLPLGFMHIEEVAEEAGVSVAEIERLFDKAPDHEEPPGHPLSPFERFLIAAFEEYGGPIVRAGTIAAVEEHPHDLMEMVRTASVNQQLNEREWLDWMMALVMCCFSSENRRDTEGYYATIDEFYGHLVYQYDRRLREPFTLRHFSMSIANVFEQSWLRAHYGVPDPNPVFRIQMTPESEQAEWNLDGVIVWLIVEAMTEPRR